MEHSFNTEELLANVRPFTDNPVSNAYLIWDMPWQYKIHHEDNKDNNGNYIVGTYRDGLEVTIAGNIFLTWGNGVMQLQIPESYNSYTANMFDGQAISIEMVKKEKRVNEKIKKELPIELKADLAEMCLDKENLSLRDLL